MSNLKAKSSKPFQNHLLVRILVFISYIICVSLLSGYLSGVFNYPSLFNATASFSEYAIPYVFTWALAHIPTMLFFGFILFSLPSMKATSVKKFRIYCWGFCLLLFLELDSKIPFILFLKIDSAFALFFSLIIVPPNKEDNPLLVKVLKFGGIFLSAFAIYVMYAMWTHRTPQIVESKYVNGIFELQLITVNNNFKKSMEFEVKLTERLGVKEICNDGQNLAEALLKDYPFDESYEKLVIIFFDDEVREIGEISLNPEHKERGMFACYAQY